MALTTQDVLAGTDTCYQGPCSDRIPLRDAHEKGTLYFVVNRSHIFAGPGGREHFGSFKTVEEAVSVLKANLNGRGFQISAVAAPFGHCDECRVWCDWWKPYGDL